MIEFYKARVQYFYSGMVNQIDFANVEEEIKTAINNQVSMKTEGKVEEIFHHEHPVPDPPMTFFAANFFQVSTIVSLTVARNWKAPLYRKGSVCKWPTPSQAIKDRVFARRTLSKSKKYIANRSFLAVTVSTEMFLIPIPHLSYALYGALRP